MQTLYQAPALVRFGSLAEMTAASLDSDRQDRAFNSDGNPVPGHEGTGSLDQCFFDPDAGVCIINE